MINSSTKLKEARHESAGTQSDRRVSGEQDRIDVELLVKGMREAGAEVEVVALREKSIKNCIGCLTCWTKTPGTCIHKDNMTNETAPQMVGIGPRRLCNAPL